MDNECIGVDDLLPYFNYPKVIAYEIILYVHLTCSECKKCLLTEYTCESCFKTRCKYHQYMAVFSYDIKECTQEYCISTCMNKSSIICIDKHCDIKVPPGYLYCKWHYTKYMPYNCTINNCTYTAEYGYKNLICYCAKHIENKKVIKYNYCSTHDCFNRTIHTNKLSDNPHCKLHFVDNDINNYVIKYSRTVTSSVNCA